jgi:hypothetical protein
VHSCLSLDAFAVDTLAFREEIQTVDSGVATEPAGRLAREKIETAGEQPTGAVVEGAAQTIAATFVASDARFGRILEIWRIGDALILLFVALSLPLSFSSPPSVSPATPPLVAPGLAFSAAEQTGEAAEGDAY